ncbi:hypothetical protein BDZ45DRAFT_699069 [Acephala macrosclerotiorum]|nr:hypothetical protein BDZ45DRAFT_699069 [Acephala macrosclerotiorum]
MPRRRTAARRKHRLELSAQAAKQVPFNIAGLLKDVAVHIQSILLAEGDLATITALGLTCRSFYHLLKSLHPKPISLMHPEKEDLIYPVLDNDLWKIVGGFLGNRYLGAWFTPFTYYFFNKDVYGNAKGMACRRLQWRVYSWQAMVDQNEKCPIPIEIPRPFGRGDSWYKDMHDFVDSLEMSSCPEASVEYWRKYPIYCLNDWCGEDIVLSIWQDRIALVGW